MNIFTLSPTDAPRYRELMLEAYAMAPDAFTSTPEERAIKPLSWWIKRIGDATSLSVCLGAEHDGNLVGTVALEYAAKPKNRHAALLIGMYVRDEARRKGLGQALLEAALAHASQRGGIEVVRLTVTEGNAPAIRIYEAAGFHAWGTQPMAIATASGYKGKVHMQLTLANRPSEITG